MNQSFYTASVGAGAYKAQLDMVANNISNVNTAAYKYKNQSFSDLVYQNIHLEGAPLDGEIKQGVGSRIENGDNVFEQGNLETTGRPLDYALRGDGFFALYDPQTEQISYTRSGRFMMSEQEDGRFMLAAPNGKLVLDGNYEAIEVFNEQDILPIGVFRFPVKDGLLSLGENEYLPALKNGEPQLQNNDELLLKSHLESANVRLEKELTKVIEAQRAMQYAVRMIQTSDEMATMLNTLR